jgi:hypothetical protein
MRKEINWSTITVRQFQEINKISIDESLEEIEKVEKAICTLFDLTPEQVGELTVGEFNRLSRNANEILNGMIPGKPVRTIKPAKQRYRIVYKVTEMKHGQYAEIMHFSKKPIENIHFIMASIVKPINWFGISVKKNQNHKEVAEEMLNARIVDVYHACVFFCKLFTHLMESTKPFLVSEMMSRGLTKEQATDLLSASPNILAGSIALGKLQHLKD